MKTKEFIRELFLGAENSNFELENNNIGLDLDERLDPIKEIYDKEDIQIHKIRPSSADLTDTPNSWEPKSEEKGISGFSLEELEKLNHYKQMNEQNRNLGIKGRPTKRDRRDLGKWFS